MIRNTKDYAVLDNPQTGMREVYRDGCYAGRLPINTVFRPWQIWGCRYRIPSDVMANRRLNRVGR